MKLFSTRKSMFEREVYFCGRKLFSIGRKRDSYLNLLGWNIYKRFYVRNEVEYKIFGLKIRRRNNSAILEERINKIEHICTFTNPPEKTTPAVGYNRMVQQISVLILKDVMRVCNEAGIDCWLSYGTVLGLYRHNGIIPWDDDIDVGMLRKDYDRFAELYNERGDRNFRAIYYSNNTGKYNFIKVISKISNTFVDVFPQDVDGRPIPVEERVRDVNSNKIRLLNDDFWRKNRKKDRQRTCEESFVREYHRRLLSLCDKKHDDVLNENAIVFSGAECVFDNPCDYSFASTIFPLQEVQFEGCTCKAPHDMELYLYEMFGDFMNYPPTFEPHYDQKNVTKQDMIDCVKFLREYASKDRNTESGLHSLKP